MPEHRRFSAVCATPDQLHDAVLEVVRMARPLTQRGHKMLLECREADEPVRIAQREFLHGAVLPQVAEQALLDGRRWTMLAWKDAFRTMFLPNGGFRWREVMSPRWDSRQQRWIKPRKPRVVKERISTEELPVPDYARFTEDIIQYAAAELGVHFVFKREQDDLRARYQPPPRSNHR